MQTIDSVSKMLLDFGAKHLSFQYWYTNVSSTSGKQATSLPQTDRKQDTMPWHSHK